MKKLTNLFACASFALAFVILPLQQLQAADVGQIRAYMARANGALASEGWQSALDSINEAQNLAGRNGAVFESIRVRAYYGMGDYARAKKSIETFYALEPSQAAINEIAPYQTMIDDGLAKEAQRIARLEAEEKQRQLESERKAKAAAERERKKAEIDVDRIAWELAEREHRNFSNIFNNTPINSETLRNANGGLVGRLSLGRGKLQATGDGLSFKLPATADHCQRQLGTVNIWVDFQRSGDQLRVDARKRVDNTYSRGMCRFAEQQIANRLPRMMSSFANAVERQLNNVRINLSDDEILAAEKNWNQFMRRFTATLAAENRYSTEP